MTPFLKNISSGTFQTAILLIIHQHLFAQHDSTGMHNHSTMHEMQAADSTAMHSNFSLHLPMSRDGSGTAWQPDESPMMMYMKMKQNTTLMLHGFIFLRYTSQDITNQGNRGKSKLDAPNMAMFMLSQKLSEKDLFSFQSMFSLDPLTEGGKGYPLLFQTGEAYNGIPLVDRQHPHDLFSALAINYTRSFGKDIDVNAYLGYPGEPAIGPVAFMHRLSAINNPDAPLGHHWQDATHITFGVGTLGIRYKIIKAEASIFTGREPDDNRYNFDKPLLDSYSYRVSANPNRYLSLQFSQGFIKSPEALEPDVNIIRTTTSLLHTKSFNRKEFIASALVYGINHSSEGKNLHSVLFESNLKLTPISLYMRYEFIQKDTHELQLHEFNSDLIFNINAFTLGVNKILFTKINTDLSLGLQGTINFPDKNLKSIYGNNPLSAQVYLKIAPAITRHHH